MQNAAIGRGIRSGRSYRAGAVAPDFLKLCRRNVSTVIGGDSGPELLAASLIYGAKSVRVYNPRLVCKFGVDAKSVVRLRGALRSESARLGKEDLVLAATRRCSERSRPHIM